MAHQNCQTEVTQVVVWLPAKEMSWEDFVIFADKNLMG